MSDDRVTEPKLFDICTVESEKDKFEMEGGVLSWIIW